jgi:hypothetical protein
MSRMDMDAEEFCKMLIYIVDHVRYAQSVMSYNDCNNCGRKKVCKYLPKPGQLTRINCPLWGKEE